MKRILAVVLCALLLVGLLAGCQKETSKTDLIVFAAASLEETLQTIKIQYEKDHQDIHIVFNFDSSGTLKTQIQEGADCDLFLSAAQKQMNELNVVLEDTRLDLLENKVALAVPEGNPKNIQSFEDLKKGLEDGSILMAMGNADVPVGQYTQKILTHFGLEEESLAQKGCLTYGSNVKEVTTQISEGVVDCGLIYSTDAVSAGLQVVDTATKEMCGQVIYPGAVLTTAKHQAEAKAFLKYLTGEAAGKVFEGVGFSPIKKS